MARYSMRIHSSDLPKTKLLNLGAFESLEEVRDGLLEWLKAPRDQALGFLPEARPAFTVLEAFALAVGLLEKQLPATELVKCYFLSERAAGHASRLLPTQSPTVVTLGARELRITLADIAKVRAEAIVNASSESLRLGGGVSFALRGAVLDPAGLQAAMYARAPIESGAVIVTGAFGFPGALAIFHAATAQGDEAIVKRALGEILALCEARALTSLALPALGCGTGRLPVLTFAKLVQAELTCHLGQPKVITLVCYEPSAKRAMEQVFKPSA